MALNEITFGQQSGVRSSRRNVLEREDIMKRLLVTLATLVLVILSLPLMSFGLNLSGKGSATVDGVMSPGEWDNAAKLDFQVNIPSSISSCTGGSTAAATLYVMNDAVNLYLAVKIARPSFGDLTTFISDFDNKNIGIAAVGDDVLQVDVGDTTAVAFNDEYRSSLPDSIAQDIAANPLGNNGDAKASKDGNGNIIIELWHPLCSADTLHDFCLKPGDVVGSHHVLRLRNLVLAPSNLVMGPTTGLTYCYADTVIPTAAAGQYYGQITLTQLVVTRVIDIKPGSRENPINRKSEGKIPVAILSTADWSAPASVDRLSLTFGHDGTEPSLAFCNEDSQDVNGDGLPDLVCHFTTQLTGFQPGDTFGILNGKTKDGGAFTAKDSVRIVK